MKLNKQGVPDLDSKQTNGRKACKHFAGPVEEIEKQWTNDDGIFRLYPVYGKVCIHCHVTLEVYD